MLLNIRKVQPEDKDRILEISSRIWEGNDYIHSVFDEWVEDRHGEFTAAEKEGTIIGFAKYTKLNDREVWLEGIRADSNYKNTGLGATLTSYFLDKARKERAENVRLSTHIGNRASIHIIEKHGFKKDGYFIFCFKKVSEAPMENPSNNVVNIMSPATAWHTITRSSSYMLTNGYASCGWVFKKMSYELIEQAVKEKRTYCAIKDGKVTGTLILEQEPHEPHGDLSISFIDGDKKAMSDLIEFASYKARQDGYSFLTIMSHLNDDLIDILHEKDFEFIDEKRRTPDVFLYTYKIDR